jgi:glycosyltransferase involved in cell wall biosynthesis
MGAAARAHVAANFSLAATAQQTLEVYQELVKVHSS